jgi:hypothetical protein
MAVTALHADGRHSAGQGQPDSLQGSVPLPIALACRSPRSGYQRSYRLRIGRPGCLVQQVKVRIVYSIGQQWLVCYRSRYHEYFSLADCDSSVVDRHDFDAARDGWQQSAIEELRRRWLAGLRLGKFTGSPRLEVRKEFLLGIGSVTDVNPVELAPGVRFGFLQKLSGRALRSKVSLYAGPGKPPVLLPGVAPCPGNMTAQGSGVFNVRQGWRAIERYRYDFACLAGQLEEDPGYCNITLPRSVTT